jgi:hypothetical protein
MTTAVTLAMNTTEPEPLRLGDHEHRADTEHDREYNDHNEHKSLTPIPTKTTTTTVTRTMVVLSPMMNDSEQTTPDRTHDDNNAASSRARWYVLVVH